MPERLVNRTGNLPGGDVDAVEDVHRGDPQDECGECLLVVVADCLVPDLIGYRIGSVAEPSDCFGEGQRRVLGVGEVGSVPQGDQGEQPLLSLALLAGLGCRANAHAATVDPAGSQVDEDEGARPRHLA
jgi:hypothetical protein